jgi:peroxiredoxin Q/BCP
MNLNLRRGLVAAAMVAGMAVAAMAALTPGEKAPVFSARAAQDGRDFTFSLRRALAKGPVVVYFFPSAFTQGCDIEAHTFAQEKAKFTAAGATIIGVSADSIPRLNAFSKSPLYCAGQFAVASDPGLKIAAEYGVKAVRPKGVFKDVRGVVIHHAFMNRETFVINRQGRIVATFSTSADHISPQQHVAKALAVVRSLRAK